MAATDWTLITDGSTGSSAIVDDTLNGAPSTTALQCSDAITFQNITGGALLDTQIIAYVQRDFPRQAEMALRSQDILWDTGTKYVMAIGTSDVGVFAVEIQVRRWDSGVATVLLTQNIDLNPYGTNRASWIRWRFSAITVGGDVLLRAEIWNGSSFVVVGDITDASVSKILTSGRARIGNNNQSSPPNPNVNRSRWDNVQILSLA